MCQQCCQVYYSIYMEERDKRDRSILTELLQFALIAAFIIIPFRMFVAQPFVVNGSSMDPTFRDGEYLVVDQLSHRISEPERGEVIIFKYPRNPSKFFIKRIIGLPGETVIIEDGIVTIINNDNPAGFELDEPYVTTTVVESDRYVLGTEEYYVMGDNRAASLDSREWNGLPERLIIGRPLVRLLPADRLNLLPGDYQYQ